MAPARVAGSVRAFLVGLATFVAILAGVAGFLFLGVFCLFAPGLETVEVRASPDGRHLARVIEVNPGATGGFLYDLEIEDLRGRRATLVFRSETSPEPRWRAAGELLIVGSETGTTRPKASLPDVRVEYARPVLRVR